MKLLRVGPAGHERPALLDDTGQRRDLSGLIGDLDGPNLSDGALAAIAAVDTASLPVLDANLRIGPCVASPSKFIGIGLNYADHAAESGMTPPTEPVVFHKSTSSICGPTDPIEMPPGSSKLDWEVELAIVIGRTARSVTVASAREFIAGFCLVNDVSERSDQIEREGQWTKGKSNDTFGPMGPYLVTRDEVRDPQAIALGLTVNGETMQSGNTSTMIFGVDVVVSYLSFFMTLMPGDVITTGTPPGVGMGMTPPRFLKLGDEVALRGDGLGEQQTHVVASKRAPLDPVLGM